MRVNAMPDKKPVRKVFTLLVKRDLRDLDGDKSAWQCRQRTADA